MFTAEPWENEYYYAERLQHNQKRKLSKFQKTAKHSQWQPEGGEGERAICFPDSGKAD